MSAAESLAGPIGGWAAERGSEQSESLLDQQPGYLKKDMAVDAMDRGYSHNDDLYFVENNVNPWTTDAYLYDSSGNEVSHYKKEAGLPYYRVR